MVCYIPEGQLLTAGEASLKVTPLKHLGKEARGLGWLMGLPRRVTNESTHVNRVPAGPEWSNRELLPITCYTVLWWDEKAQTTGDI